MEVEGDSGEWGSADVFENPHYIPGFKVTDQIWFVCYFEYKASEVGIAAAFYLQNVQLKPFDLSCNIKVSFTRNH